METEKNKPNRKDEGKAKKIKSYAREAKLSKTNQSYRQLPLYMNIMNPGTQTTQRTKG
jgi:hypothetical protein